MQIPAPTTIDDTTTEGLSIREEIIDPLSDGDHHSSSEIPSETVLPNRDGLHTALTTVQSYLKNVGCAVIADAHLRGLAAPVHMTSSGTVYAVIDENLFEDVIMETLSDLSSNTVPPGTDIDELVDPVRLAHTFEFQATMNEEDVDPTEAADWPGCRGQQTSSTTGIVVPTPHPVRTLETHTALPERAIGMVAGIQHLTTDVNGVYGQKDIAAVYLYGYLTAHGLSGAQATSTISNWYELPTQCLTSLLARFEQDVVDEGGLPGSDPEYQYYLTSAAHDTLTTVK